MTTAIDACTVQIQDLGNQGLINQTQKSDFRRRWDAEFLKLPHPVQSRILFNPRGGEAFDLRCRVIAQVWSQHNGDLWDEWQRSCRFWNLVFALTLIAAFLTLALFVLL